MKTYILFYDYVADVVSRRSPFREEHLGLARELARKGTMLMAGAFAEPVDGAALVFRCDTAAEVEAFATVDPYVREGLVTAWRVRDWSVVDLS